MSKNPKYPATTIPYLMIRGAAAAIEFYTRAFGAKETMRIPGADGSKIRSDTPGISAPSRKC